MVSIASAKLIHFTIIAIVVGVLSKVVEGGHRTREPPPNKQTDKQPSRLLAIMVVDTNVKRTYQALE